MMMLALYADGVSIAKMILNLSTSASTIAVSRRFVRAISTPRSCRRRKPSSPRPMVCALSPILSHSIANGCRWRPRGVFSPLTATWLGKCRGDLSRQYPTFQERAPLARAKIGDNCRL